MRVFPRLVASASTPSHRRRCFASYLSRTAALTIAALLLAAGNVGAWPAGQVEVGSAVGVDVISPSSDAEADATIVTLNPDRDSWLKSDSPGENRGGDSELLVETKGGQQTRTVYHFDLASIPTYASIESATLNLWVAQSTRGTVNVHRITDTWTEGGVTWSNTAADHHATVAASFTPSRNDRFVAIDVRGLVIDWVDGTFANDGLMLLATGGKEAKLASREWSDSTERPYLRVTYSTDSTNTPRPPTATPVTPTATRTATPVPPTNTPAPPTSTRTATPIPPTNTPAPPTATRTATSVPPTHTPAPPTITPGGPTPTPGGFSGLWISAAEVQALPTTGTAWTTLLDAANSSPGTATVCDQDSNNGVIVLAKALVFVRTGTESYRTAVRQNVMAAIGTEDGSTCRSLALGRELAAYVVSADLVGLTASENTTFRNWLTAVRTQVLAGDSRSLVSCHEDRPNNWGTMCGASRAAASAYLGDATDLARTAQVFKGYLGDRASYAGFDWGSDMSWHADSAAPRGINPQGAVKQGVSIDGVLPDDMRRGGPFTAGCPASTGYPWEALQGVLVQAEILYRQGYDAWNWQNQAERRAVQYLRNLDTTCGGWWAAGDDAFSPWIVNHVYGTTFPASVGAGSGKIMGWTDWTHNRATRPRQ